MTSPMKSAPSVAANATLQATMIQNQPRVMRYAFRASGGTVCEGVTFVKDKVGHQQ